MYDPPLRWEEIGLIEFIDMPGDDSNYIFYSDAVGRDCKNGIIEYFDNSRRPNSMELTCCGSTRYYREVGCNV